MSADTKVSATPSCNGGLMPRRHKITKTTHTASARTGSGRRGSDNSRLKGASDEQRHELGIEIFTRGHGRHEAGGGHPGRRPRSRQAVLWRLGLEVGHRPHIRGRLPCKTVAAVCNSTGALRHVKIPGGRLLVAGATSTGFTDGEEDEVNFTQAVPFLVEGETMTLGAIVFQGQEVGDLHRRRRPVDHRQEPGLVWPGC